MTPKEKAKELFYKMLKHSFSDENVSALHRAKQCALIAVDEILCLVCSMDGKDHWQEFYEEVKKEINKL